MQIILHEIDLNPLKALFSMHPVIPLWLKTGTSAKFREFTVGELPRCTRRLCYQQMIRPGHDGLFGTFCFEALDLSRAVYGHLKANAEDGRVTVRDHDFFDWLRGRDRDSEATTILPSAWGGIEIVILMGIIELGRYDVWCHACRELYKPANVSVPPRREHIGSIYERLVCPREHLLSRIEVMHIV